MAKNPSLLPVNFAADGTSYPETDYLFDDSGLPTDVEYLGVLNISGATTSACIVAGDPVKRTYGKVALKDIATTFGFGTGLAASVTAKAQAVLAPATGTASGYTDRSQISFGYNESTSTVTIFIKNAVGNSLSGRIVVGQLASATAWTNILGPTI